MVPAYSVKVPRVSTYSGYRHANRPFTYGAFTLSGRPSQAVLLSLLDQFRGPNPGVHALRFGLFRFRSPLLPESHVVFSSSGYLDVSVHPVPFIKLCIHLMIHTHYRMWVPPFGNLRVYRICAPYRSLSQLITSFIGSQCQGIHPMLFVLDHSSLSRCSLA